MFSLFGHNSIMISLEVDSRCFGSDRDRGRDVYILTKIPLWEGQRTPLVKSWGSSEGSPQTQLVQDGSCTAGEEGQDGSCTTGEERCGLERLGRLKNVRLLVRPTMAEDTDTSETVTGPQSFKLYEDTDTSEMVTGPKSFDSELVEKEEDKGADVRRPTCLVDRGADVDGSTCLMERCGKSDIGGDVREVEMNVVEIYRKRWR